MKKAKLIGSLEYAKYRYPKNHPLKIPRVSLLLRFLEAMELISEEEIIKSRQASMEELLLFHDKDYIETLIEAEKCQCVPNGAREKYNIGSYENPVSYAMFTGSSLATGSTIQAIEEFLKGNVVFNPAGGMHHAFRNRANGFCYINDPAVGIEYLRKKGFKKILYIDLDAHHCDGVQEAFYETDEVFVLSLHQSPQYAFPFKKGYLEEIGEGKGKGFNLNIPLPKGVNDDEFLYALENALNIVKEIIEPEVYLLQLGTDPLLEDYLSKFNLSNVGFLKAFNMVRDYFGEGIYLGGGGYHPYALARAWTLIWCEISKREPVDNLTNEAKELFHSIDFEEFDDDVDRSYMFESLKDSYRGGEIRKEVRDIIEKAKVLILNA
ncbi:MAG: acetoin utilization protein AcuC [Aquifex sp.]|nr:MAG: acetoin utilization protein AcuC [Aquifex sp.]